MEPALVYYSDCSARVVVCLPTRSAVSAKSILANHRGARAARFLARPALWQTLFFIFPNKAATLGCEIPALGGAIPIEEFVFYLAGFMLVLLSYIWCDEYWMAAYNVPDYTAAARGIPAHRPFSFCFCRSWRCPDRRRDSVPKVCIRRSAKDSRGILFIFVCASADSIGWLFSHRTTIHQLARIQLHVFSASADQLALGSDARFAAMVGGNIARAL